MEKIEIEKKLRFKNFKCSEIINNEHIFSATLAKEMGSKNVVEFEIKKIYYSTRKEFLKIIKKYPKYSCWDSKRKIIIL